MALAYFDTDEPRLEMPDLTTEAYRAPLSYPERSRRPQAFRFWLAVCLSVLGQFMTGASYAILVHGSLWAFLFVSFAGLILTFAPGRWIDSRALQSQKLSDAHVLTLMAGGLCYGLLYFTVLRTNIEYWYLDPIAVVGTWAALMNAHSFVTHATKQFETDSTTVQSV